MPPRQRPRYLPVTGSAALLPVLLLLLLAACAPRLAQPRLPDGSIGSVAHSPEQAREQSRHYARMARAALAADDVETAAGLFEQALLVDGDNAQAAIGYGDVLLRLDRPHDAGEVYARAFAAGGAPAHQGYARAMIALARPEAAVEHLGKARELAPRDPAVLNALGVARDMLGQHERAAQAYREGLALAPEDRSLRNNLGLSLALAGEADAAIATLRELAEGARSDQRSRQNLALAYGLKGDLVAAERLSRIDLREEDVRNNLRVFAALRGATSAEAARALAVVAATAPPSPSPRRAGVQAGAGAEKRADPAAEAPAVARVPPRGPIPLTALALDAGDLDAGDLAVGGSPAGSWFVELGRFPNAGEAAQRWDELRRQRSKVLTGLSRLAGAGADGPEPLLAGPLPDEAAAKALCAKLGRSVPNCVPLRL